jgi:sugar phosphate isomerase/epimerase
MERREFLKSTALAGTAMIAPYIPSSSLINRPKSVVMNTNWGWQGSLDAFLEKTKNEGYDGVELWWPGDDKELYQGLQKHGLSLGYLCGSWQTDFEVHFSEFKKALKACTEESLQKPLYINCHSGKDFYSLDQNRKIVEFSLEQSVKAGIPIYHETHRGRMCYSAPITRDLLNLYPEMKLTLDASHWTNVHESLLEDQVETMALALSRTEHIHARIGHQEGPQVNDPRAPEWKRAVEVFMGWWDEVVRRKEIEQAEQVTFLTEFGPPHYLQALPYTQQPVANQWDINVYMMKILKERYK